MNDDINAALAFGAALIVMIVLCGLLPVLYVLWIEGGAK